MKRTAFILVVAFATFFLGCQENHTSAPAPEENAYNTATVKGRVGPTNVRSIELFAVMRDPTQAFNSYIEVKGQVEYTLEIEPILREERVSVGVATDGAVRPYGLTYPSWTVSGVSHDNITLTTRGVGSFKESYEVKGRRDGLILHVLFNVTLENLSVESAWLTVEPAGDPKAAG